jgi:hypothetical protein
MSKLRSRIFALAGVGFLMLAGQAFAGPVFVVDFLTSSEGNQSGVGQTLGAFNLSAWGFADADYSTVTSMIMLALGDDYLGIPTQGEDSQSPIPDGEELNVSFMQGTLATVPQASDYYYVLVGSCVSGTYCGGGTTGLGYVNSVRFANGTKGAKYWGDGYVVADIFTDALNGMGGLSPSDALKSGDLLYTTNVIAGTLAHEIGHTLSLLHDYVAGADTVDDTAPIMGTGALDLSNQARLEGRSFAYSANKEGGGQQYDVQQLVSALGLQDSSSDVPEPVTFVLAAAGLLGIVTLRRSSAA